MYISIFKFLTLIGVARGALEGFSIVAGLSSSEVLSSTVLSAITPATSEVQIAIPGTVGHTDSSTSMFIPGITIYSSKASSKEDITTNITSEVTLLQTLEPGTVTRASETSSEVVSSTVSNAVASPVSPSYTSNGTMNYTPKTTSSGLGNNVDDDFASTFDWKRVSINTEPVLFTVPTQVKKIAMPTEVTTMGAIISSFFTTDVNEALETTTSLISDESTSTVATTTSSRGTETYTSTIKIKISSAQSYVAATTSKCVLSTVFITVTPIVSTAMNDNLHTTSSVSTDTSDKAVKTLYGEINETPKYSIANSTFVGSGIPTDRIPAGREQTRVAASTSASAPLASVYVTKPAQPVFTGGAGGAVNVLNHNKKVLVAFATLITLVINGRRFL